ncbi:MAG: LPS export ABC transporter permease LptG [Gammaproteobacteria bacterium]|nr:LPS export ABC transporter permease LptG [Gammaproteobacteria bacterium]
MSRLDRYIMATVLSGALAGLFILVCINFVFEFIDEAGDIGQGNYGLGAALLYVSLQMVHRAYEAFPMATLIGALVSLGALAARSELVVMRAVGMSVAQIARSVVYAGLLLALLAAAIGEWFAPPAVRLAQAVQAEALGRSVDAGGGGFWVRDGDYFLHGQRALRSDLIEGVVVYEVAGNQLVRVLSAPVAEYTAGRWVLAPATITAFLDNQVVVSEQPRAAVGGELDPDMLEVVVVDAATLAVTELVRYIRYLELNNLDSEEYRLAFWIKLSTPLATIVMLLLTVPLVFGSQRSAGVGQKIFLGVLIGLGFFLINRFLNNAGVIYGLPAPVSALSPTALFLVIALIAMRRVR